MDVPIGTTILKESPVHLLARDLGLVGDFARGGRPWDGDNNTLHVCRRYSRVREGPTPPLLENAHLGGSMWCDAYR